MATTHTVRIDPARPGTGSLEPRPFAPEDRRLWIQVTVAAALGATAGVLATWAVVATQTLQMHF
ncbi:MAG: hypothetical protein M0Z98_11435 [Actinomycetales bacterium]|nr:hypothetical protein [Actinomycetales bacterium]